MGLIDMLGEWIRRKREQAEKRNMKQATDYFGSLLKKRQVDTGAVCRSIEDYKDFPTVTKKQTELLLKHRSFRYVSQMGCPEWRAVMDTLKDTQYGMLEGTEIPRNVKTAVDNPMLRLVAQYRVLEYEYMRRNSPEPLSSQAQTERDAAHRLLNCCMKESDMDALKALALKGVEPENSVAIRYGLAEGYCKIRELNRERADELRGDNRTAMDWIELKASEEKGKLMQQAAGIYEREMAGRLPDDYSKAVREERGLLWELSRVGWNENLEVPVEMQVKYGLAGNFTEIADCRFDYTVSMDMGDYDRDYPQETINFHSRAIREQAGKELEKLEARLFPEKAESGGRKTASAKMENRRHPSLSVGQQQKAQPGREQDKRERQQRHNSPQSPGRARIKM